MTSQSELLADPSNFIAISHCSLCGATERDEVFAEEPFHVVRCEGCGLVYVTPRLKPDVLPHVYDEGYWTSEGPENRGYADYRSQAPLYLKTFRKRFELIQRYKPEPGRLLDVGCAAGFFLKVASEKGWDVEGVELSAEIAAHAREDYGFGQVHVGTLETAPYEPHSFDLLTLWDVVEHVPDPAAFLEVAMGFLKPDGLLILETQNVSSAFANRMGPKWQHYKHLEHLYHFNPETIQRLLDEAGFDILENTPDLGGKHVSVEFIRERAERVSPAFRYLLWPLAPFNRMNFYVNLKDEMVIAAETQDDRLPDSQRDRSRLKMELAAYQQFADLEEEHFWFQGRRSIFFALLDKEFHGRKDLEILEVGCGAGGLLKRLAAYGNAKGLELWPELCKLAKDRSEQSMICGNAYAIPLADQSQDLVCLFDTIEHIPDEAKALAEIHRVLKPGGTVFFSVPAYQFLFSNNDRVAHHCRRYTKGRLRKVCIASGLEPKKLSYFNSFLFPLILPAVLLGKAKEKWIGLKDPNKTNLSRSFSGPINATFASIMGSERHLLRHVSFPVGHSLLGMFQRPAGAPPE